MLEPCKKTELDYFYCDIHLHARFTVDNKLAFAIMIKLLSILALLRLLGFECYIFLSFI